MTSLRNAAALSRARALPSNAIESSRSTISASAPLVIALSSFLALSAGTNRRERIALIRPLGRIPFGRFLHQRQSVSVGIGKECHPQIMIVHLCDQMWRAVERKTTPRELGDDQCDVGAAKIDAAALDARHVGRFFEQ